MSIAGRPALLGLLLACMLTAPPVAGVCPYVRLDHGGNELRMSVVATRS